MADGRKTKAKGKKADIDHSNECVVIAYRNSAVVIPIHKVSARVRRYYDALRESVDKTTEKGVNITHVPMIRNENPYVMTEPEDAAAEMTIYDPASAAFLPQDIKSDAEVVYRIRHDVHLLGTADDVYFEVMSQIKNKYPMVDIIDNVMVVWTLYEDELWGTK